MPKENPLEALLGPKVLFKVGKVREPNLKNFTEDLSANEGPHIDTKELHDKDFVLLYFSAAWCPPCQKFSPLLKEFYKTCKETIEKAEDGDSDGSGIKVEVVYVSSDRDEAEFEEYYGKMPWLAVDGQKYKDAVTRTCRIKGIPTLVVLTGEGKYVTDQARDDVAKAGGHKDKVLAVLASWKEKEAVPLDEAQFSGRFLACQIM